MMTLVFVMRGVGRFAGVYKTVTVTDIPFAIEALIQTLDKHSDKTVSWRIF